MRGKFALIYLNRDSMAWICAMVADSLAELKLIGEYVAATGCTDCYVVRNRDADRCVDFLNEREANKRMYN